ncbi:MAG: PLP-dependent aspartate aminotransferase family protein [Fimbriimonadales bacterium]|nr:PLP-dependent aspartate aminotransferase family protein [Fimbriimonadales bacterium]
MLQHVEERGQPLGALVPPLFQSAIYTYSDLDRFEAAAQAAYLDDPVYSPWGNPTVSLVERKMAALDGTEAAKLTGDGMAAIGMALLASLERGSHVVTIDSTYSTTLRLLRETLRRYGVEFTCVDGREPESVFDAVRPDTSVIFLESPSSLLFRLQDLGAIAAYARQKGIVTIIDNTYSTPLRQRPAEHGIDIVVQSTSKYLGGHSDLNGGAICASQERIDRLAHGEVKLFGTIMAPFVAWLLLRGMRTLALRLRHVEESANHVAAWLQARPEVETVHHLGLQDYPQRELFLRQMRGSTGLFSFVPRRQDRAWCKAFLEALKIFRIGVSWGGPFSLAMPALDPTSPSGSPVRIIRLYCGLESQRDLIADLQQALEIANSL